MNGKRANSFVNDQGFIITEVSKQNISSQFDEVVHLTINSLDSKLGSHIHSIYLYGSVVAGRAIVGKSDLDVLVVFKFQPDEQISKQIDELSQELSQTFKDKLREVGLAYTYLEEIHEGPESLGLKVFLKHLCVCLYGSDLSVDYPCYKPTKRVAAALNGDAPDVLNRLWKKYGEGQTALEKARIQRSIARKVIRTGSCFASAKEGVWATDREDMAQLFMNCYPNKAEQIEIALFATDESNKISSKQLEKIKLLSDWVSEESRHVFASN
ncbi:nucleotidyltransferase domain-containing protein [Alkalibacillus haloalkaliphilus]|uniref:nucleotidyltransferase domain-containing protein n=1 Tax=Alkalibacillus haloalkaliphilus TaxID=94136 RepID=UPI002935A5D6|nr:nucleotidyltransferase domain-containing protein [Alkalibacillus haloalkaliphilus]MDV2581802.1 nucleotidyltransferase domain-containing protein [Alkalibacillus haloalkaliphilus]